MSSGGSQPATTQQTSKVELPAWVQQASQENYNFAKQVADRPFEQYQGDRVAAPSDMTTQAYDLIKSNVGATNPLYDQATGAYNKANSLYDDATAMYKTANPYLTGAGDAFNQQASTLGQTGAYQDKATGLYDKAASTLDATNPLYNAATGAAGQATGMLNAANPLYARAADVYNQTTGPLDVNRYLNPYTNEVEQRAIGNANTALTQQLTQQADQAQKAKAFGGSRAAVQQGVTSAEGARGIGDLSAALRKQGIDYATQTGLADRAGMQAGAAGLLGTAGGMRDSASGYLGAGQNYLNTAAGMRDQAGGYMNAGQGVMSQIDRLLGTASGYGNVGQGRLGVASGIGNVAAGLGNAAGGVANTGAGYLQTAMGRQSANQQDIASLLGAGQQEQGSRQNVINSLMDKFNEARNAPLEALNTRLAALGMSPYGKTETSNKTATSEDKGTDWATVGLGALKTLPALVGMFSDREAKTDIKKLTGGDIPLYAYRYKGDPKSYPKVVGPMAQDIEKKHPKAVKKIGGHRVVDINNLMEVLK